MFDPERASAVAFGNRERVTGYVGALDVRRFETTTGYEFKWIRGHTKKL